MEQIYDLSLFPIFKLTTAASADICKIPLRNACPNHLCQSYKLANKAVSFFLVASKMYKEFSLDPVAQSVCSLKIATRIFAKDISKPYLHNTPAEISG